MGGHGASAVATDTEAVPQQRRSGSGGFRRLRRRRLVRGQTVAITVAVVFVLYLVLGPLLTLIYSSFRLTQGSLPFESLSSWTLHNFHVVFLQGGTYGVLWDTIIYCAGALLVSFAISIALAWLVERTDMPGRSFVAVMAIGALGIPGIISAISWALLLSPRSGVLNDWIRTIFGVDGQGPINIYSLYGMVFAEGLLLVPITFLMVTAAFRAADTSVEEAGSTSGAGLKRIARAITLPLLIPALLSALIYQFVSVIESIDVPLVLGLPGNVHVLSTEIYTYAAPSGGLPNYGQASAYSILLILLSIAPLVMYNRVIKRSSKYAVVGGKSQRARRVSLGKWRWAALTGSCVVAIFLFVLPVGTLVWSSLQPFFVTPSADALKTVTLAAYRDLFTNPSTQSTLVNTIVVAAVTGILAMVVGVIVAWILVRTRSRLRPLLDAAAFLPHAMPGVIIGTSVLLLYLYLPIPIVGTIWIIAIGLTIQSMALSTRLMTGNMAQLQASLEEAGATSGASWGVVMRRIVTPLVRPAFLNGFVLIFLLAIKSLSVPLMLYGPHSYVASTKIWALWLDGKTAPMAALGTVMVAITLTLAVIWRRLDRRMSVQLM